MTNNQSIIIIQVLYFSSINIQHEPTSAASLRKIMSKAEVLTLCITLYHIQVKRERDLPVKFSFDVPSIPTGACSETSPSPLLQSISMFSERILIQAH